MDDLLSENNPNQLNEADPDNGEDMAGFSAAKNQREFLGGATNV